MLRASVASVVLVGYQSGESYPSSSFSTLGTTFAILDKILLNNSNTSTTFFTTFHRGCCTSNNKADTAAAATTPYIAECDTATLGGRRKPGTVAGDTVSH